MNAGHHNPDHVDAQLRQLHAQALGALSPQTLARLRDARHGASRPRRHVAAWLLATACTTVLAVGFGLQLSRSDAGLQPGAGDPLPTASAAVEGDDMIDQNPDLYVWLGSETALAME